MSDFDGLLFDDLSEFKQDLLRSVNEIFPKETNKFLKDEAKKLLKNVKKDAKRNVGTSKGIKPNWIATKSYHGRFKVGKLYIYSENDKCIRVYNTAPHAHLIEQGHRQVPRGERGKSNIGGKGKGWTEGKFVMLMAQIAFKTQFETDVNEFLYKYVDDTCNGKF